MGLPYKKVDIDREAVSKFYNKLDDSQGAWNQFSQFRREGRLKEAGDWLKGNRKEIQTYKKLSAVTPRLSKLRAQIDFIEANEQYTGEMKEKLERPIRRKMGNIARTALGLPLAKAVPPHLFEKQTAVDAVRARAKTGQSVDDLMRQGKASGGQLREALTELQSYPVESVPGQ